MRSHKVEGLILKRSNLGEADKLLTIFTRRRGKIKVLAKGVRRIKSRRAPHLELFNQVELLLYDGKTFPQVSEVRTINEFVAPKSDLQLTGYFFYLAEVIDKILPDEQPHVEVYKKLLNTMSDPELKNNSQGKIKEFVVQLLWELGYLPKGEYPKLGLTDFVEVIVERRIRSKKFLEKI